MRGRWAFAHPGVVRRLDEDSVSERERSAAGAAMPRSSVLLLEKVLARQLGAETHAPSVLEYARAGGRELHSAAVVVEMVCDFVGTFAARRTAVKEVAKLHRRVP